MDYNLIGALKMNLNEHNDALDFYAKSLQIFNRFKNDSLIAAVYNNLGIIYESMTDYRLSEDYFNKAVEINIKTGNYVWLAFNYSNLGRCAIKAGETKKGLSFFDKSLKIATDEKLQRLLPYVYNNFSYYYQAVGNFSTAVNYARMAMEISKEQKNMILEHQALIHLREAYYKNNDLKNAYLYSIKVYEIADTINRFNKLTEIDLLEMRYAYEKEKRQQQLENELLETEIDRKELMLSLIVVGAGSVILIFILLYVLQHQRIKRKDLEQKTTLLEKEKLEQQLDFKNNELTTNVMYLLKKNELITNISNKLRNTNFDENDEKNGFVRNIVNELDRSISEHNWTDFEVRFQEVHVDFYNKLTRQFTDLTPNELRLCAFLKLNMTSKEIAEITYQSLESLKTARYRLRKKLGMDRDENLVAFLARL